MKTQNESIEMNAAEMMQHGENLMQFHSFLTENHPDTQLLYATDRNISKLQTRVKSAIKQLEKAPAGIEDFNKKRIKIIEQHIGRPVNRNENQIQRAEFVRMAREKFNGTPTDDDLSIIEETADELFESFRNDIQALEDENESLINEMNEVDRRNHEKLQEITEHYKPHYLSLSRFPENMTPQFAQHMQRLSDFIIDDTFEKGFKNNAQIHSLNNEQKN